ncbi:hypothetical protein J6590_074571 [Homalodisca vitripennis]|nr:hypothetical protein J6590_074571 [Homalodisca vitripennis]
MFINVLTFPLSPAANVRAISGSDTRESLTRRAWSEGRVSNTSQILALLNGRVWHYVASRHIPFILNAISLRDNTKVITFLKGLTEGRWCPTVVPDASTRVTGGEESLCSVRCCVTQVTSAHYKRRVSNSASCRHGKV